MSIVEIQGMDLHGGDVYHIPCASLEDARALVRVQLKSDTHCFGYQVERKNLMYKEKSKVEKYHPIPSVTMFFFGKVLKDPVSAVNFSGVSEAKTFL